MRHLDLSFEGKYLAEKNQLDNGKLPHGGYRGSKKHPPSHLSYDKGREFQQRLEEELARIMDAEDMTKHGGSPSWSLLVHNSPSYTDESPLITNNLLAASKAAQINGISMYNRTSLLPKKQPRPAQLEGGAYYRPNRMHQYLSATELKNSASGDANVKYGRPTRTTLLRARQRSNSAPLNQLEKKKDFAQRLDEIKTAPAGTSQTTEYLQLQSVRDGESLHSYLTGARYNRAHCLDSKSVEHNGVYMPRHNPALGMFFTGPKGQEYLQEFEESPRQDVPTPPSPPTAKRRPLTAPSYGRRPLCVSGPPPYRPEHPVSSKYKYLKLNIVGSRLPLVNTREPHQQHGMRLPKLSEAAANLSDRRLDDALDQTFLVNQPMSTPSGVGVEQVVSKHSRVPEPETPAESEYARFSKRDEEDVKFGAIRIEGRSTWKVQQQDPTSEVEDEEEQEGSIPVLKEEEEKSPHGEEVRDKEATSVETNKADVNQEIFEVEKVNENLQEDSVEKETGDVQKEPVVDEREDASGVEEEKREEKQPEQDNVVATVENTTGEQVDEDGTVEGDVNIIEDELNESDEKDNKDEDINFKDTSEEKVKMQEDINEVNDDGGKREEEEEERNVVEEEAKKLGEENVLFFITENEYASKKVAEDPNYASEVDQQNDNNEDEERDESAPPSD